MIMAHARTGDALVDRAACTVTCHGYHTMSAEFILSNIESGRAQ